MYRFINIPSEYKRIIQSVLIDKRASIAAIKDKSGDVIKSYIDAQAALVSGNCMFYKIETDGGNLVGYFTLKHEVYGVVTLYQYEIRPAFVQFDQIISNQVANFMQSNDWFFDT